MYESKGILLAFTVLDLEGFMFFDTLPPYVFFLLS